MKNYLIFVLFFICVNVKAQKTYTENIETNGTKIMVGYINKEVLMYEPSFKWFTENATNYNPTNELVQSLTKNINKVQMIVFGGTWCDDTKSILPKFFTLITKAGYNQSNLTILGVDRNKKTYGALAAAMGITNVPTFIIMQNGKELGRVVEYGKTGHWDTEIGEIVNMAK